jgi:hypothetical protein
LLAVLGFMLSACATIEADRIQYAGAPRFPARDPAVVEILRNEPTRPNDRLGEVVVDASVGPSPPIAEVESRLRAEAAQLGADAVVVVYDGIDPVATVSPWWGGPPRPVTGRRLVGVAIKYQAETQQGPG